MLVESIARYRDTSRESISYASTPSRVYSTREAISSSEEDRNDPSSEIDLLLKIQNLVIVKT